MAIAAALGGLGALERFVDGAAHHELSGQHAHRRGHRLAHHGLARAREETAQRRREVALIGAAAEEPPGEHQCPGRSIDEERVRLAEMTRPISRRQLVTDQPVDGGGVGNAQQGLGQAHEGDALGRRQRVFMEERVDAALAEASPPRFRDQTARPRGDARAHLHRERGRRDNTLDRRRLVHAIGGAERSTQGIGRSGGLRQDKGHRRGPEHARAISAQSTLSRGSAASMGDGALWSRAQDPWR